jgi:hypothetical protein
MMRMTRKKAIRKTVEVRETRGMAVLGEGGKENKRRRLRRTLGRCVGVKMVHNLEQKLS